MRNRFYNALVLGLCVVLAVYLVAHFLRVNEQHYKVLTAFAPSERYGAYKGTIESVHTDRAIVNGLFKAENSRPNSDYIVTGSSPVTIWYVGKDEIKETHRGERIAYSNVAGSERTVVGYGMKTLPTKWRGVRLAYLFTEEPTDEMLQALMEDVAAEARKSMERVEAEKKRRMQAVADEISSWRARQ